jgi:5-methyltetrahydropteroyltriglutamate--homocysteine methyltransferase
MTMRTQPPFRADHVGSFLRPQALLEARGRFRTGELTRSQLREVEDSAIRDIVRFQEDLGLFGITDGEFRRTYFHIDFLEQLDGVETKGGIAISFHSAAGDVDFAPPVMQITAPVRHARPIQVDDFNFLKSVTRRTPKSPFRHRPCCTSAAAEQRSAARLTPISMCSLPISRRHIVRRLPHSARQGAATCSSTIPISPIFVMRKCAKVRDCAETIPTNLPRRYARLINAAISERPPGMTICIHLCRGNFKSAWVAEGGYEPVAEVLFNELKVDGYFLEYDDARSGDFSPLRHVPRGKMVVLGLVTTKVGKLETKDSVKRKIDEAEKLLPLEQLCLSPQCGFSSTVDGNEIAREAQAAKLRLVVETAREVWGE